MLLDTEGGNRSHIIDLKNKPNASNKSFTKEHNGMLTEIWCHIFLREIFLMNSACVNDASC